MLPAAPCFIVGYVVKVYPHAPTDTDIGFSAAGRGAGVYADKDVYKQIGGNEKRSMHLAGLVPEVLNAAHRQGYDVNEIYKRAISYARSEYYRDFFDAINEQDEKKMDEIATALLRLNAVAKSVQKSMDKRFKIAGREITESQKKMIQDSILRASNL